MRKIILGVLVLGLCLIKANLYADGNDIYTKLLLHFNGVNGSTSFVDSSFSSHSVTPNGDAQIDTAQSKFGGASGLFDGNGDFLTLDDHADWAFENGDFTIDFWMEFKSLAPSPYLYYQRINDTNRFQVDITATNLVQLSIVNNGTTVAFLRGITPLQVYAWYHFAIVRNGDTISLYLNGVLESSVASALACNDLPAPVYIAGYVLGGDFNGWLDEFRVSKGIARWNSNFTPPTEEYDTVPNTLPLAHAGPDVEAYVNEEVFLDGRQSYDPDGQIISWVWRSLSDPQKSIVAEGETATINAHGYAEELIELTVTDNYGGASTDTMKITNPGIQGPVGPPGITPEEIAAMEGQISLLEQQNVILQQQNTALQQQNVEQQLRLEQDRYLLQQLPQLHKKIEGLKAQAVQTP
ncbi:MAG: LamG domain-containing protein [Candidatus Omnitrophica bacterium]|nr:LamG domain-containing protein [Candidatus Omnitrophota bacterium]